MCLIAFHLKDHPTYAFIMAANRDEFYDRPTAPAHFWEEQADILAGKDLHAGGTWLGITKAGRIAALTNYRDPLSIQEDRISRGEIVKDFLAGDMHPTEYMDFLESQKTCYNGFNLLLGTVDDMYYYSNMTTSSHAISAGTHALSNKFLNTPWPKVERAREHLNTYVSEQKTIDVADLLRLMEHVEPAEDRALPDTGVGIDLERKLSPMFIHMPNYGTRSTTIIAITHEGEVSFVEQTYVDGKPTHTVSEQFRLMSAN